MHQLSGGTEVRTRPDGRVQSVTAPGMAISHNSMGNRTTVIERQDRSRVVIHGGGQGYVERPFSSRDRTYVQRTYYSGNVSHVYVYRPVPYRGMTINVYTPTRYYSPGFYGWAYSPWRSPVYYNWGWNTSPWYGYYGGYYSPYPYYASPALWLTDFMVSSLLQSAYQERLADARYSASAQSPYSDQMPMSQDVKDAISQEVQRQLEQSRMDARNPQGAASADGLPAALTDGQPHVVVVARARDVRDMSGRGQECVLTEGDVLSLQRAIGPNDAEAILTVLAAKSRECRVGTTVAVPIQDVVEMLNHMRQSIDQGLEELQSKQGQSGLPRLPSSANGQPIDAGFAASIQPEQNLQQTLAEQSRAADRVESDAASQTTGQPQNSGAPGTITLGQSMDDVRAILGTPSTVVDLGSKKIFVYRNMKVVFQDGRVSDVQ